MRLTVALHLVAVPAVIAAFAGNTEISYCEEEKNYSISIDELSYARNALSLPTLLVNGSTTTPITNSSNTTYEFAASFRFGDSPPITAQNGTVCGNLTAECPVEAGPFVQNWTLPDWPVYLYPAIVNVSLRVWGVDGGEGEGEGKVEGVEEWLCIQGPLMPFGASVEGEEEMESDARENDGLNLEL